MGNYDDEYMEYEMGLEGEYEVELPPGYESWAEWHYINGDRLPDESDFYDYDMTMDNESNQSDSYYWDKTDGEFYWTKTHKKLTQKQIDKISQKETDTINALAAELEENVRVQKKRQRELKQRQKQDSVKQPTALSMVEIKQKAAEMGVHPDMFSRQDDWCWEWIRDFNTWFYHHPRFYQSLKIFTFFIVIFFLECIFLFKCT